MICEALWKTWMTTANWIELIVVAAILVVAVRFFMKRS